MEENKQKDIDIDTTSAAGRKVRGSIVGKVLIFGAGVVTASLIK